MRINPTLLLPLLLLLCIPSCRTERTIYDEYGNVVDPNATGADEKDLSDVMNARFDAAFSEKKNKDGVPETTSGRVSRYQRDIDNARSGGKEYATKRFDTGGASDLRSKTFGDAGKSFEGKKAFEAGSSSSFSRDMRPDFLNDSHGIAHEEYRGAHAGKRYDGEYRYSRYGDKHYSVHPSDYDSHDRSTYVEYREARRSQPGIIDHKDQGTMTIDETRRLLGRDESALGL